MSEDVVHHAGLCAVFVASLHKTRMCSQAQIVGAEVGERMQGWAKEQHDLTDVSPNTKPFHQDSGGYSPAVQENATSRNALKLKS